MRHIERVRGDEAAGEPSPVGAGVAATMSAGLGARVVLALVSLALIAPLAASGTWYLWRPPAGLICSHRGLYSAPNRTGTSLASRGIPSPQAGQQQAGSNPGFLISCRNPVAWGARYGRATP